MTVTYPLAHPTSPGFKTVTFTPSKVVGVSRSAYSLVEQVNSWPGEIIRADMTLPVMQRAAAEQWIAFFMMLRGRKGTFLLGDPDATTMFGTPTGTPVLDGAHTARDEVIAIKGMTPSSSLNFGVGDYIQFGTGLTTRMHKILEQVDADGSGEASGITIFPALRADYADGTAITYSSPVGLFRLATNSFPWSADELSLYQVSLSAEEVVG
jgi:hypothetical protein